MLEIHDLHVSYGPVPALRGVSLQVRQGECVTLLGANGAGKSTLLRAICRQAAIASGSVRFQGQELSRLRTPQVAALGISLVPEGRHVFAPLTVRENLEIGAWLHRHDRAGVERTMEEVFNIFPVLAERQQQLAGTLSGGQQQMLAIGRALMSRPQLLLLDEPSLGLSPILTTEVYRRLRTIIQSGRTVLVVEQNAHVALQVADRGYVLENGRVALEGTSIELRSNPRVQRAYLGGRAEVV